MARAATVIGITSVLIVLASFAGQPPNLEKALEAQQQLISQQPYDSQARNDLGNLLLVAGHASEAERSYRRAVELDSGNTAARFNLAIFMQQSGRAEEAMGELRSLLEVDPYHAWGHYQLGVLFDEQGDRADALEHYARAFAYDPALTFAENNPHIIDNRMATEALLMSQRYRKAQASGVPRLYSNPDRIVDLLLGKPPAEGDEMEAAAEPEDQTVTPAASNPRRSDARLPSATTGDGVSESDPQGEQKPAEEDEEDDGHRQRRVLTPASVEGGSGRNRASTAQTSAAARPDSRESLRQAFEERFRAARERSQSLQPSSGAPAGSADASAGRPPAASGASRRPRYIPGRASTGRLELELRPVPEEPAERHAALNGSAAAS